MTIIKIRQASGNSKKTMIMTLPVAIATDLKIKIGDSLAVSIEDGKIVLRKIKVEGVNNGN